MLFGRRFFLFRRILPGRFSYDHHSVDGRILIYATRQAVRICEKRAHGPRSIKLDVSTEQDREMT